MIIGQGAQSAQTVQQPASEVGAVSAGTIEAASAPPPRAGAAAPTLAEPLGDMLPQDPLPALVQTGAKPRLNGVRAPQPQLASPSASSASSASSTSSDERYDTGPYYGIA
ncbi:MAG: hypothetical protein KTR20_05540 [Cellvibrionaceae bacterium]|nr:hypothetical protein [Cellvibrionaceae bacterium]